MVTHGEHVCRGPEEVDLHLRQPGHRVALHQEAGQRSQDGVLALPLSACHISKCTVGSKYRTSCIQMVEESFPVNQRPSSRVVQFSKHYSKTENSQISHLLDQCVQILVYLMERRVFQWKFLFKD